MLRRADQPDRPVPADLSLGILITAGGTLLFPRSSPHASYLVVVLSLIVIGFGNSLSFAPMTTAVLNSVETDKSGVALAINGAIRETASLSASPSSARS